MISLTIRRLGRHVAALLFTLTLSQPGFAMTESERQARLQELRATIDQLKQELDSVKSNRNQLLNNLQESETKISELNKKVQDLRKQLEAKQSQLQDLRSEKEALATAKKQQQGSVGQQLNAAYRLGQQSGLKLLLNQQDPASLERNLRYYRYVASAQAEKLATYTGTLARMDALEPVIEQETAAIAADHADMRQKRDELVRQQTERKRTLDKLESAISSTDARLKANEEDRRNLEALLARVAKAARKLDVPASGQAFSKLRGQLPWPTKGKVVRNFGSSRVAGKMRWQGMLIDAPEGHPVQAVYQGRVVFADYLRGQGLLLIVDHGAGFMSLYAHNQSLFKGLGDWVKAGEQVASVGTSGGRDRAGLYFELRFKGEPTDPRPWLKKSA